MAAIPVHVFLLKTLECLPIAFQAKESSLTIRGEPSVICPPAYQTPSGLPSSRDPGLFAHLEHCMATPATGSLLCLLSPFSMLFPESVFSLIIEDALRSTFRLPTVPESDSRRSVCFCESVCQPDT